MKNNFFKSSVVYIQLFPEFLREVFFEILPPAYRMVKNLRAASKGFAKELTEETSLTKKQAKKVVNKAMEFVFDELERSQNDCEYSKAESYLLMLYSIRSDKSYEQDVHNYCDAQFKLTKGTIESDDEDVRYWLTLGHQEDLKVLIDRYMSRFDKFKESKKYNGIWY